MATHLSREKLKGARTRSARGLRITAGALLALFAACFVVAVFFPGLLETRGREFVVDRISAEIDDRFGADPADNADRGPGLIGQLSSRADSLWAVAGRGLDAQVSAFLSTVCHYDCPSADSAHSTPTEPATGLSLQSVSATMRSWARAQYSARISGLVGELRIFAGLNASLFFLLLVASLGPSGTSDGVQLAMWLLLASTGVAVVGYVFLQDWFYAVLFGRYLGYGYLAWVGGVFAVLLDCVFNRARVSQRFVDAVGAVLSPAG